jgi:uncharacterized damage-inducible protein DinB
MRIASLLLLLSVSSVFAQTPSGQGIADVFDAQVSAVEREILGLAQKVPADLYDFAPSSTLIPKGAFDNVQTFGVQVRHTATMMYQIASSVLGEKPPVDIGTTTAGPENLRTKEQILEYFQGAIAFSHKAMRSLTAENAFQPTSAPIVRPTRAAAAAFLAQHSYDHYGQMVVYARMNGITPGAAPAAGKGK